MRAGAETKGRVAIALAIGFCVTAMSAQRTQQALQSGRGLHVAQRVTAELDEGAVEVDLGSGQDLAQHGRDLDEVQRQQEKMLKGKFTLDDFRNQMQQVRRLGPIREIMKMIPGLGSLAGDLPGDMDPETDMKRIEAIIGSMTLKERERPEVLRTLNAENFTDASIATYTHSWEPMPSSWCSNTL